MCCGVGLPCASHSCALLSWRPWSLARTPKPFRYLPYWYTNYYPIGYYNYVSEQNEAPGGGG